MFIYVFYGLCLVLAFASPETVAVPIFGDPAGYKIAAFVYFAQAFLLVVFCSPLAEIGQKEFKLPKNALIVVTMIFVVMALVKGILIYSPLQEKQAALVAGGETQAETQAE